MKILHSADWHLDAPLSGRTDEQARRIRQEQNKLPERIVALAKQENCDLMLLAGDLFDRNYSRETFRKVYDALAEVKIPVFIAPGNHDFCQANSPYLAEVWPENVYIFDHSAMETVEVPGLDCTVYGAGFTAMDCPGLLEDFHANGKGKWHIGIVHGDATSASSVYCPVTPQQVRLSGLHYLALGHIHKGDSFRTGDTLCAWPGCPMGYGYDETGVKGVLLVELQESAKAEFVALEGIRFYDEEINVGSDAALALTDLLPGVATEDFYRVTLVGYSNDLDLDALRREFAHIKNLELRDKTIPEKDLWRSAGEDNLEGMFFAMLQSGLDTEDENLKQRIKLAAQISRKILDGQEVVLP